jgi:Ca2+-binding EF-hand superfamily protein
MTHRSLNHLCIGLVAGCTFALGPAARADNKTPSGSEMDHMFQMMDSNGDGKLSSDEHAAGVRKMFDMMDANKDGKVTAAEMDAAHERMGKKAHTGEMSSTEKIRMMDTDNDGVLTADEHAAGAKMMFDKMDTNKDGFLSKSEMAAGHQKMMQKSTKGETKSDTKPDRQ